jgi:TPP-dependent indolepyruvate ferredoxin oxidoreductase alpha subunit
MISLTNLIAKSFADAGVSVITAVPGIGVSETYTACINHMNLTETYSFHEEPAYTIAHGAAITGKRSASLMKSHGFAKAANSIINSLTAGVTAGLVIIVFHDREGTNSDNKFNIKEFINGSSIYFRESYPETIYNDIRDAFFYSEKFLLPSLVLVDTDFLNDEIAQLDSFTLPPAPQYKRDITLHLLCPLFARYQYDVLQTKLARKDYLTITKPPLPLVPDALPTRMKEKAENYKVLFSVFKDLRGDFVSGDAGTSSLFGFPPFNCIDVTTYMGGSIPLAVGAYLAGYKDVWAVTGDFSFIAAGALGLIETRLRNAPVKIIICNDGEAGATGGQKIPPRHLESILAGYSNYVEILNNPYDEDEISTKLLKAKKSAELSIVLADFKI